MSDYMSRYSLFMRILIRCLKIPDNDRYGRKSIVCISSNILAEKDIATVVDIAAGRGADLLNIKNNNNSCTIDMYACEAYKPNVSYLEQQGINTFQVDIEWERLPFDDNSVDIIIANQILEHCKEIWWIFSEAQRVLKPGGYMIVGVPNLASLHCRLMLLFGKQPPCIETHGPHVRGFVYSDLKMFAEYEGYFEVEKRISSGFYFVGRHLAPLFSRVFPNAAVCMMLQIRKTEKEGLFINTLLNAGYETNFYSGEMETNYIIGKR